MDEHDEREEARRLFEDASDDQKERLRELARLCLADTGYDAELDDVAMEILYMSYSNFEAQLGEFVTEDVLKELWREEFDRLSKSHPRGSANRQELEDAVVERWKETYLRMIPRLRRPSR